MHSHLSAYQVFSILKLKLYQKFRACKFVEDKKKKKEMKNLVSDIAKTLKPCQKLVLDILFFTVNQIFCLFGPENSL